MSDAFIDWIEVHQTLEDLDLGHMMDLDPCAGFQNAEWPVSFSFTLTGTPSAV